MCVCVCVVRSEQEPEVGMVYNKQFIIQYARYEHKSSCKKCLFSVIAVKGTVVPKTVVMKS
jgi:hypothetical protein